MNKAYIGITLSILSFWGSCTNVQVNNPKSVKDNNEKDSVFENIWIPDLDEESYSLKSQDTLKQELSLVFERSFDDSLIVLLNSDTVFRKKIKTNLNLSVVEDMIDINYKGYTNPQIEIALGSKNSKIVFQPKKGYRMCYVNYIKKVWTLTFSNYPRIYY